jgi:hypothetical protein
MARARHDLPGAAKAAIVSALDDLVDEARLEIRCDVVRVSAAGVLDVRAHDLPDDELPLLELVAGDYVLVEYDGHELHVSVGER